MENAEFGKVDLKTVSIPEVVEYGYDVIRVVRLLSH